jgi:hypothetical protein
VPVDDIMLNRSITDRYSNIISMIETQAKETITLMKSEAQKIRELISEIETKEE